MSNPTANTTTTTVPNTEPPSPSSATIANDNDASTVMDKRERGNKWLE